MSLARAFFSVSSASFDAVSFSRFSPSSASCFLSDEITAAASVTIVALSVAGGLLGSSSALRPMNLIEG